MKALLIDTVATVVFFTIVAGLTELFIRGYGTNPSFGSAIDNNPNYDPDRTALRALAGLDFHAVFTTTSDDQNCGRYICLSDISGTSLHHNIVDCGSIVCRNEDSGERGDFPDGYFKQAVWHVSGPHMKMEQRGMICDGHIVSMARNSVRTDFAKSAVFVRFRSNALTLRRLAS